MYFIKLVLQFNNKKSGFKRVESKKIRSRRGRERKIRPTSIHLSAYGTLRFRFVRVRSHDF